MCTYRSSLLFLLQITSSIDNINRVYYYNLITSIDILNFWMNEWHPNYLRTLLWLLCAPSTMLASVGFFSYYFVDNKLSCRIIFVRMPTKRLVGLKFHTLATMCFATMCFVQIKYSGYELGQVFIYLKQPMVVLVFTICSFVIFLMSLFF